MSKTFNSLAAENKLWEFMPSEEEHAYYEEVLRRVIHNPRYYLDNLDELSVFRVSFIYYYPEKKYIEGIEGVEHCGKTKHL